MTDFEAILSLLDFSLNAKRKRHLLGGTLLSVSALFGGLAITIMTLGRDDEKEKKDEQNSSIRDRSCRRNYDKSIDELLEEDVIKY